MLKKSLDMRWGSTHLLVPIVLFFAVELQRLSDGNAALVPQEENILETLRQKFNQTDWTGDPCLKVSWIGCSNDSLHVTKLSLPDSNLKGTLPAEVGQLTHVRELLLNSNNLTGPIPDLRNLTELTNVDLKLNRLSGRILDTRRFANLTRLVLNDNNLTGGIPTELFTRRRLQLLYMGSNPLGGPLPDMSQLKSMKELELHNSSLTGSVPRSIQNMTLLANLHLYGNPGLHGLLPNLSALVNLAYVNLSGCGFNGSFPDFKHSPGLVSLDLGLNDFSGEIPPALFQHEKIKWLNLNNNSKISGEIPDTSGLVQLENLFVNDCNLTGAVPSFRNNSNVKYIGLYNNKLTRWPSDLGDMAMLVKFLVANNTINGNLPDIPPNNSTTILDFSRNRFSGGIPMNWTKLSALISLKLGHNNLSGVLQPEIGNITTLTELRLNNNRFSGSIPKELGRLTQLQILDLDDNQFTGVVPEELADLPNLRQLLLRNNSLDGISEATIRKLKDKGVNVTYDADIHILTDKSGLSAGAIAGIVTGAVVTLAALCTICIAVLLWKHKKRRRYISKDEIEELPKSIQAFSLKEIKAITGNYKTVIGRGGFGIVYYGRLPNDKEVAVKVRHQTSKQRVGVSEFINEVKLLARVHHRNLVPLVGYSLEGSQQTLLYDYMAQGSLYDHLYHTGKKTTDISGHQYLSWKNRLKIAIDAARGIEYLHKDCNPPVIHRDIKASNILLNANLEAKIADMGISKQYPEQEPEVFTTSTGGISTAIKGTVGYLDPEYFVRRKLTTKSDVFSFGVVLLELITGRPPQSQEFPGNADTTLIEWVQDAVHRNQLASIVDPAMGVHSEEGSLMKVAKTALSCVLPESGERPNMSDVILSLTEALQVENQSTVTEHVPTIGPDSETGKLKTVLVDPTSSDIESVSHTEFPNTLPLDQAR